MIYNNILYNNCSILHSKLWIGLCSHELFHVLGLCVTFMDPWNVCMYVCMYVCMRVYVCMYVCISILMYLSNINVKFRSFPASCHVTHTITVSDRWQCVLDLSKLSKCQRSQTQSLVRECTYVSFTAYVYLSATESCL